MAFGHPFLSCRRAGPESPVPRPFSLTLLGNISKTSAPDFHPGRTMALQIAAFHSLSDKAVGGAVNGQDLPLCPRGGGVSGGTGKGTWGLVTWENPALQGHGHQWAPPSPLLLLQPHLHSYKEAFEEMEGTSPTSPPPTGGKSASLSLSSLSPLEPLSQPGLSKHLRFGGGAGRVGQGQDLSLLVLMAHFTSPSLPDSPSFHCPHAHMWGYSSHRFGTLPTFCGVPGLPKSGIFLVIEHFCILCAKHHHPHPKVTLCDLLMNL